MVRNMLDASGILSKYIAPGCRVELKTIGHSKTNADGGKGKSYHSQVVDVLSEDRVEIIMPTEKAKLVLLPVDKSFDLTFYSDNALFQCRARVTDRYKNDNMYVVVLELTSSLRKKQRRDFYRFSCLLELESRQLDEEEVALVEKKEEIPDSRQPLKKATIVDISGGGLRFVAKFAYKAQCMILCKYQLVVDRDYKEFNVIGKVLSVRAVENQPGLFEHRIQFVNMDAALREEIIRYIFDAERKTLGKQKGDSQYK